MSTNRFRLAALAGLTLVLASTQMAWAATTLTTATTLATELQPPTEVVAGANSFQIKLWGVGGNIPNDKTGEVDVVTAYTMAVDGTITPGAATTLVDFANLQYQQDCPATGAPLGCPTNPHVVNATLTVAAGVPAGTNGIVTVAATPRSGSGVTDDVAATGAVRVKVVNAAPTVGSITGVTTVDEQTADEAYALTASDADGDTLTTTWAVVSGNATIDGSASGSSVALDFGDGPSTVVLRAVVDDGHGHSVPRSVSIGVLNVAPTATFVAATPVDEGSAISLSLTSATDRSTADATAGFTYAFDCGGGYGPFSGTATASCPTDDDGVWTVKGKVRDRDGGEREHTASVAVSNVAPTATFSSPGSVSEGSTYALSLTNPTDPSNADTTAGFSHAFDCGDALGYGTLSSTSTASCVAPESGSTTTRGAISDKDGGRREYTGSLDVTNVAPTAIFTSPSTVDEGSPIELSLTAPYDPSAVDTAAGFEYAFDCGRGYGDFGPTSTATCPTTDDELRTVKATIRDADGGATEHTAGVTITNVAPTATFDATPEVLAEGASFDLSLSAVVDPGDDTLTYAFDCGDGYGSFGSTPTTTCATLDDGGLSVGGKVRDEDGGEAIYAGSVTVSNVAPSATFTTPTGSTDEGSTFTLQLIDATDPSPADVSEGLEFAFDCDDGNGYSDYASSAMATCSTSDQGSRAVKGKVRDKDDGVTEYSATVTVVNVAPTGRFTASSPVDEGSPISLELTGVSDPSAADTGAGFEYAFDCGDGYGDFGTAATVTCPTDDDGTRTVRGAVRDKDGGTSQSEATVSIDNVAPTATFTAPVQVDEGSAIALGLSGPSDPSSVDVAAGFEYAFDCGSGAFDDPSGSPAASCSTSDSGTRSVRGQIIDKDGDSNTYGSSVTVLNVAPTATFGAPASVDEGTAISLALTNVTDPSSDDTTAGFQFAFDCGEGFGPFTSTSTASCSTSDNGSRDVGAKVRDKDGGVSEFTASVTITNVAPTATFGAGSPITEGTPIPLSITNVADVSSADAAAGFTYAFDCGTGAGYGSFTSTSTATCPTGDDGSRNVGAKVRDKDGGISEHTAPVTIENAAPVLSSISVSKPAGAACASNSVTLSFSVTDAAAETADPVTGSLSWGDGTTTPISGRSHTISHSYPPGTYLPTVTVDDGDGGSDSGSASVALLYSAAGVLQPINMDGSSSFKLGSTIPVKTRVLDCNGVAVSGVPLQVAMAKVHQDTVPVNEVVSSSAADSGNLMRWDGQQHVFNLSTKRSQFNAGNDLTSGVYRLTLTDTSPTQVLAPITVLFKVKA